ncbi:TPA: prepilin-type cleavage/methylation domain-containing protein [Candidatus Saccharibacteria bacterium]|nr:MAG: prepilin-type cleavage/methylation protein [Candidatus Saccharibacteria bacterium GW2011_GWC2_44_17]MBH1956209.1 type II secretion system protein [Candidatus Saccharibacteria bacterium]OGL34023.1 MAG: hypothetical protein A3E20_05410 [Candidatus Saccharibacteria bacterium RIFCSPHIGHO2_12_FULL_47_16]MBH1972597.1 type II secretion system protein [Candidatus Saccharibacteria bacterium]MBH1990799.1 type II secretion system protein [Candidatus Saccharibacteria bacterium]
MSAIFDSRKKGFTIVELLIVIAVIGILAAITMVAYSSVQNNAKSKDILSTAAQWEALIRLQYSETGKIPLSDRETTGTDLIPTCLGRPTDFPATSDFQEKQCITAYTDGHVGVEYSQSIMDQFSTINNSNMPKTPPYSTVTGRGNGRGIGYSAQKGWEAGVGETDEVHVRLYWLNPSKGSCGTGDGEDRSVSEEEKTMMRDAIVEMQAALDDPSMPEEDRASYQASISYLNWILNGKDELCTLKFTL